MNNIQKFTFYRNYYEIVKYLPTKDRLQLYDAILEYMFEDKEPELKELLKGIWINIKMPLDTNKKNNLNGQNGGRPKKNNNPNNNPKETQKKPKQEPKAKANNISYFLFLISNFNYKYIKENNNIYNTIKEWLEYKQQRKEQYTEKGLEKLLTQIENNIEKYDEEKMINVINESMANNWAGIIFDKLKKTQANQQDIKKPYWKEQEITTKEMTFKEQEELKSLLGKFN